LHKFFSLASLRPQFMQICAAGWSSFSNATVLDSKQALFLEGTERFFFRIAYFGILFVVNIRPG
jgi:hypothetical protein